MPYLVGFLAEELERGEALHLDLVDFILGGVHLGNHNVLVVLKVLGEVLPDRS